MHVILRWYRLVAFQTCTGTFQALSQCASTNIKALQLISALSGEASGLAAKAVQRNAVCSAWRKMELQFEHPCRLISLCCIQRGFMDFRMGSCSALTQDSMCVLAALGEPRLIPMCSSSWKVNVFSTWSTTTCFGLFISQYSCWSPFFSYQRQL